jgi:hypothetical protein
MATYTTYNQIGIKEDISDIISNISPTTTPFLSSIGKESVKNTLFQWQEDSLSATAENAEIEGFTASDLTLTPTVMRSNHTQIQSKTIKISATADAIDAYGRAQETAYQLSKKAAEFKRDIEFNLVGNRASNGNDAAAGSSSAARLTANIHGNDAGSNAVIASAVQEAGGSAALSEQMILNLGDKLYDEGSEVSVLMIKPADSTVIAGFTRSAVGSGNARQEHFVNGGRTLMNVVDVYISPYGEQRVVMNRFMKTDVAFMYDPANWKICELRPMTRELLAKTGDADMHMMVTEYGLKHANYKASGLITAIT